MPTGVEPGLSAYVPRTLRSRAQDGPGWWSAEGTLVFADVSGFTRLTEKLSLQGKAGAEEIVTTISSVFTELLAACEPFGGDVLKFGGDALLLWFDGAGHAPRAGAAAVAMQRTLRRVGGVDTSRGRVRLRMSIGAHAGRVLFSVAGDDHLELFVLGPDATTTTRLEAAAGPGEVLVSPVTAAALGPGRRTAPHEAGVLLRRVAVPPPAVPAADPSPGPLDRFLPPRLRDRLGDDDGEHEHRRVTIAFARFTGVDELLASAGAAEVFARVQALTTACMHALDEYGVLLTSTDLSADGGTFMLTAGAPEATGDEEARMLRVARRLAQADCGLDVQVGVNTGDVFVGAVGAPHRRTYSTMGAATNLAARLMGHARPGEVLATRETIAAVEGRFRVDPIPPVRVRGAAKPVAAALVGEPAGPSHAVGDDRGPIVGRARELAALDAALADVRAGRRGHVLEFVGGPGLGKSRLVAELRRRATGLPWLATSCDPFERTSPHHTARVLIRGALGLGHDAQPERVGARLREAVRGLGSGAAPGLALVAAVVGAELDDVGPPVEVAAEFLGARTREAVADLLEAVVTGPGVVAIESAHCMDDASAELVAELLRRGPANPWLVVVTREPGGQGLRPELGYDAEVFDLAPLTDAQATQVLRRLAERAPVPAHLVPVFVERAGGNPLFLTELAGAPDAVLDGDVPRSIEGVLAARIDALAPPDRRALRALSVLGDRFPPALAPAVVPRMPTDPDDGRWRRLAAFLRVEDGEIVFRSGLVRQVAYEGLSFQRRRELHARAAAALEAAGGRVTARAPLHLVQAGRWADAWRAALDAAARAEKAGAATVAAELYELALTAGRRTDDVAEARLAEVALLAGAAWERDGLHDRAATAYRVAARTASDATGRLEASLRRAGVHERTGDYVRALRGYARVLSGVEEVAAQDERLRLRSRARAGYAACRLAQGRPRDALRPAQDALAAAGDAGDPALRAQALHLLDRVHTALGEREAAARYRDAALPLFAEIGDLSAQGTVLYDLGAEERRAGRLDAALWLFERSREVRDRAGDVVRAAAARNAVGEVLLELGDRDGAAARFTEALRIWRGARSPRGVALASRNLAVVRIGEGGPAAGVELLEESASLAGEIGAAALRRTALLLLAEALCELGRIVEAWEAATEVLAAAGDDDERARAHRVRATALEASGGHERAAEERRRAASPGG